MPEMLLTEEQADHVVLAVEGRDQRLQAAAALDERATELRAEGERLVRRALELVLQAQGHVVPVATLVECHRDGAGRLTLVWPDAIPPPPPPPPPAPAPVTAPAQE